MNCSIPNCPELASPASVPPLCEMHFDLDILVGFIEAREVEVTPDTVRVYYQIGQRNSNNWALQAEQIDALLPGLLAARYPHLANKKPAVVTTTTAGPYTPAGAHQ